jgi:hypothetical protein
VDAVAQPGETYEAEMNRRFDETDDPDEILGRVMRQELGMDTAAIAAVRAGLP